MVQKRKKLGDLLVEATVISRTTANGSSPETKEYGVPTR